MKTKILFLIYYQCVSLIKLILLIKLNLSPSLANHNYIALGISQTNLMTDTSNIECIQETTGVITAYTSWMLRRTAHRTGVDQTIITLLESNFIDDRIFCKIKRETVSILNDKVFDLENDKHYLMIASGVSLLPDSVGNHGPINRGVTNERISLINPPTDPAPPTDDSIYDGCGTEKLCFGMPRTCVSSRTCQLLSTIKRINDIYYQFEMLSLRMK